MSSTDSSFQSDFASMPGFTAGTAASRQPSRVQQETLRSTVTPYTTKLGTVSNLMNNNSTINETDNIKVAVRVRPLFPDKVDKGAISVLRVPDDHSAVQVACMRCPQKLPADLERIEMDTCGLIMTFFMAVTIALQVVVPGPAGNKMQREFKFHACLGPDVSQSDVLQLCGVHQLLDAALAGYNVTIFAYGQTGSGKTYTMSGREEVIVTDSYQGDTHDGIMSRSVSYMYQQIKERSDATFKLSASYLEIYNESVFDLLDSNFKSHTSVASNAPPQTAAGRPVGSARDLGIKWDPLQGFFVPGLKQVSCGNLDSMMGVIRTGMKRRHVGSHELNMESSRSHSLMTIHVTATSTDPSAWDFGTARHGKIAFVDLAGSERLKDSKSEGTMLKETTNINKSLFVLGKVISALAERDSAGVSSSHIPYRDSKLTKLLMDSLGGSALALMIACCSPSINHVEETLSTLTYATRAKNIQNRPTVQYDPKEAQLTALRREIELLRQENQYLRDQLRSPGTGLSMPHTPSMMLPLPGLQAGAMPPANITGNASESHSGNNSSGSITGLSRSPSGLSAAGMIKAEWPGLRPVSPNNSNTGHSSALHSGQHGQQQAGIPGRYKDGNQDGNPGDGVTGRPGSRRTPLGSLSTGSIWPSSGNPVEHNAGNALCSNSQSNVEVSISGRISDDARHDGSSGPLRPARPGSGSSWKVPSSTTNLSPPGDLASRLKETQSLLAKFSEENTRLARENDRLRVGRAALGTEHAVVLDEIESLRSQLSGLETAVLAGNASPTAAKAMLVALRKTANKSASRVSSPSARTNQANSTLRTLVAPDGSYPSPNAVGSEGSFATDGGAPSPSVSVHSPSLLMTASHRAAGTQQNSMGAPTASMTWSPTTSISNGFLGNAGSNSNGRVSPSPLMQGSDSSAQHMDDSNVLQQPHPPTGMAPGGAAIQADHHPSIQYNVTAAPGPPHAIQDAAHGSAGIAMHNAQSPRTSRQSHRLASGSQGGAIPGPSIAPVLSVDNVPSSASIRGRTSSILAGQPDHHQHHASSPHGGKEGNKTGQSTGGGIIVADQAKLSLLLGSGITNSGSTDPTGNTTGGIMHAPAQQYTPQHTQHGYAASPYQQQMCQSPIPSQYQQHGMVYAQPPASGQYSPGAYQLPNSQPATPPLQRLTPVQMAYAHAGQQQQQYQHQSQYMMPMQPGQTGNMPNAY